MEGSEAVAALAALAQESRLQAFRRLVQAGPAGLPAGRIAEAAWRCYALRFLSASSFFSASMSARSLLWRRAMKMA